MQQLSPAAPAKGTVIRVHHAFHDGSACLPVESWKFSEAAMPQPKSRWILLLRGEAPYSTYRGDFGRLPATPENLARVAPK